MNTHTGHPPTGVSRKVASNQPGCHDDLSARVTRYRETVFQRPVPASARQVFETLEQIRGVSRSDGPRSGGTRLILDSGCGTGDSTRLLARQHGDHTVIGIDKSAHRLGRERDGTDPPNLHLVRGNLVDLYPLMAAAGWRVERHCLFYPNPWPKAAHLTRRWHASPVFPAMLALGGEVELRTNWQTYADEFAAALSIHGLQARVEALTPAQEKVSPFEAKYAASGHALWRVTCLAG